MSTLALPVVGTSDNPQSVVSVTLEGLAYQFAVRWNERSAAWFLDVLDAQGVPLVMGRKVVADWMIIGCRETQGTLPALFPGILWATDTSGQGLDPGIDDLGTRVQLVYVESTGP